MALLHSSKKTPVTCSLTLIAVAVGLALQSAAMQAQAQASPPPSDEPAAQADAAPPAEASGEADELDRIEVVGIRQTQRTSSEVKRDANVIVDALVSDEIGASPDLSVGETLERVTGVTADRFKGSASEISVRGLGPFLGFSTLNGREVSSGSGDRAVSFQQFPSEIVNGVVVYKSQRADLVEGGVSGVLDLQTISPLDYGKQRLQVDLRGSWNEYDARVDSSASGLGYRASIAAIDQWDTAIGRIGGAFGYARIDASAPEDFYAASSSFRPCNTVNTTPNAVSGGAAGRNCSYDAASGNPAYFVANGYTYRQLETRDERDALIGALEWRPNDAWNLALDVQASSRLSVENRHDLTIADGRRGIAPVQIADNGALEIWRGNSVLDNISTYREREEDYLGGGFRAVWRPSAAWSLSTDLSYSKTEREQLDRSARLRSNTRVGAGGRVAYTIDQRSDFPRFTTVLPIDLNDHALFSGSAYARRRAESRLDEIKAARFDVDYTPASGWLTLIEGGLRISDHDRVTDLGNDNDLETIAAAAAANGQRECALSFPQDQWGSGTGATFRSWATFDARCLYRAFTGTSDRGPLADARSADDIDINEKTTAAYLMANFAGELGSLPYAGNIGVRGVRTEVTSTGYRGDFSVTVGGGGAIVLAPVAGSFSPVTIRNSFTDWLPSANLSLNLREDLILRAAAYRAMARPNIESMGAGRFFVLDSSGTTVADAIAGVSGGNPRLEPLLSDNYDLSLEWYPNADTQLSFALYYKRLSAGIVSADANALEETFTIDGTTVTVPVAQQTNDSRKSDLHGAEITVQHAMTWLPAPFDGLGVSLGYNYADSNFEYEDPSAVDPANPLRLFTEPAGIVGFSRHSGSASLYYESERWTLRALYKYRSRYFKPFELNANRYVRDAGFLDLSADFRVSKQVQLRLQALNVLNQPQVMDRPVDGSVAEASYFGTTWFAGVRLRF